MTVVTIRRAALADAAAIARLATQLGYTSDAAQVAARLTRLEGHGDIQALVADSAGEISGFVGLMAFPAFHRDGLHGYITALVVEESLRGGGIGGRLLAAAEAWFAERGVKRINLTTALHREDAHVFYERRGYTFTGKRYTKIL